MALFVYLCLCVCVATASHKDFDYMNLVDLVFEILVGTSVIYVKAMHELQ